MDNEGAALSNRPFQRKGAISNAHVGRVFESKAQAFFLSQGLELELNVSVPIGVNGTKLHAFDLGSHEHKVLVECKSHTWTEGGNVPSAKMTAWNQAMYYFYVAPEEYRKILFVLYDFSEKREETLAEYYLRTNSHLIPKGVELWEYKEQDGTSRFIEQPIMDEMRTHEYGR